MPYGHGAWIQPPGAAPPLGHRTILAYSTDFHRIRVNYYSGPNTMFNGNPTGDAAERDNVRLLTERAAIMAGVGDESGVCGMYVCM